MSKLCTFSGCKVIVRDGGNRCAEHQLTFTPQKRVYQHHFHQGKNIYWTNRWKKARAVVLSEEPLCRMCGRFGINTPATVVDHIYEIKDGADPFERSNMQPLCRACHNKKTAEEAKKRRREEKQNGFGSLNDY